MAKCFLKQPINEGNNIYWFDKFPMRSTARGVKESKFKSNHCLI